MPQNFFKEVIWIYPIIRVCFSESIRGKNCHSCLSSISLRMGENCCEMLNRRIDLDTNVLTQCELVYVTLSTSQNAQEEVSCFAWHKDESNWAPLLKSFTPSLYSGYTHILQHHHLHPRCTGCSAECWTRATVETTATSIERRTPD